MPRRPGRIDDFTRMWAGQTISEVGSQVTILAFPTLAVLGFQAGPATVGLLVAAARLPFPVLALVAGVIVDRLRKRPMMVVCDLARVAILVAIPLLWATGALHLWHLYLATVGMGIFTVFFDIAYLAYVPALVGREELLGANSRLEVSMSASSLIGPGLGGLLVQAMGAARAVLADATSFVVSAASLLTVRHHETTPERQERRPMFREMGEGLRHVFANPVLRAQLLCMGAAGLFAHAWEGPFYVYAYNQLHVSPGFVGGVLAVEGAGAIAGTLLAGRVTRRVGVGPSITVFDGLAIGLSALIPLAAVVPPAAVLFPTFAVMGACGTIGNIAQVTLRQSLSPEHLQGRMTAVFRTFFWGAWPLGNLLGGLVAASVGATTTILAASVLGMLVNFTIVLTPLWRVRDFGPAPVTAPVAQLEPQPGATLD
jgi:MFS family permease